MVTLSEFTKSVLPKKLLTDALFLDNPDNVFYVHAEFRLVRGELKCISHYAGIKGVKTTRNKQAPMKVEDVSVDEEVFL